MKKAILLLILIVVANTGCADNSDIQKPVETTEITTTQVETAPTVDIDTENLTPISGDRLNSGTYTINVNSSSSMFNIEDCQLTVSESGEMTACMTMGGKGYLYVFMGKGENAGNDKSNFIPFIENESGAHTFTVPVDALDKPVDCAAFSKKKEQWYDRTLVFCADTLPDAAYKNGRGVSLESLALADGTYQIEASVSGGSGRASIQSPAKLTVTDGLATAEIAWSSPNYDYMMVDGVKYDPINAVGENSTFIIPVKAFDTDLTVSADTTAMSTPHEIEYKLHFKSGTIK